MSSKIRLKKICEHCRKLFTAKTTKTRFCSHRCNAIAYKLRVKQDKIIQSNENAKTQIVSNRMPPESASIVSKELVSIKELSVITSFSERTLFRLIKDKKFPKIKVGKRLAFNKDAVIKYFNNKYGNV
jgi:excisionase family DNA binding protein